MSRQQRRQFERQLRNLIRTRGDDCSLCGAEFQHNRRTFGGYDQNGNIALVGECCVERLHKIYTAGLFSCCNYDFLPAGQKAPHGRGLGAEEVTHALGALERAIAAADEQMPDDLWQRAGMSQPPNASINVLDRPWKQDDRAWFEQHPERSHRARFPFDGEVGPEELVAPEGHRLLLLLRQVEPGKRIKTGFFISSELPPVPDVEAVAHALFDIATRRVPVPRNGEEMCALIEKYQDLPEVM